MLNARCIRRAAAVSCIASLLGAGAAAAAIVEDVVALPVEVSDVYGQTWHREITVTIWREDARERSPFLILNHGRAGTATRREKLGRAKYSANSRYFVSLGYAVFVPTRVGYGVTGGPDVEYSGKCSDRDYPPAYEVAAQQSLAVIAYAKTLPYVDPAKGLVVGSSFGGATAIALAAKNVPGVVGAVNFAGGGGGRPKTHPADPCRNDRLTELFAGYGTTSRIPTLWLYSENDRYFGTEKPRAWLKAFEAGGGIGRFVQLPPFKDDGHPSFTRNPSAWRPAFERFIKGE